jgi:hypothetical protein
MEILQDPEWQGEVMYGGGARGGKSYLSCHWIISSCFKYPGSAWLIGFEELKHLRRTTLPDLINVIKIYSEPLNGPKWKTIYTLNQMDMIIQFPNDSKIYLAELSDLPSDPNFDRLGSYSLTGFAVDEAQRVSKKAIDTLQARLSLTQGKGWKTLPKALYTCNPKKNWIYTEFWKPIIKDKKKEKHKKFITSLYTDNPHIDHESYRLQVLNTKNKVQIERLLNGNFEYDDDSTKLMNYDCIQNIFSNGSIVEDGKKCIVVDVARLGKDKTTISAWSGWKIIRLIEIAKDTLDKQLEVIEKLRIELKIAKSQVLVDEDGVGGGIADFGGYKGFVANSRPIEDSKRQLQAAAGDQKRVGINYKNLKAQCAFYLADKVNGDQVAISCNVSPSVKEIIIEDLDSYKRYKSDSDQALQIEPKEKQKELLGRSPDYGDIFLMRSFFDLKPTPNLNPVFF